MNFYTIQHQYYCGVDLHSRSLYVCVLDATGNILKHRGIPATPADFLALVEPYRQGLVVAAECMFCWYWLSDACEDNGIPFVLGHALYMKAIHGGKAKNDRLDSMKIAHLLRGGNFPQAYAYPRRMRATRDLCRRRLYFVRHRAELISHIRNTASQYNLPEIPGTLNRSQHWEGVAERFPDPNARRSVEADLAMIKHMTKELDELQWHIEKAGREFDYQTLSLLRSVPGIGQVLALTILYEIDQIARFDQVQNFLSYGRLVVCAHASAGKIHGTGGRKIGNAHLKWAFSEAAVLFLRDNEKAKRLVEKLEKKHGKGKALSILARRLATAVYYMLKRKEPFHLDRFFAA
jgi:transposase